MAWRSLDRTTVELNGRGNFEAQGNLRFRVVGQFETRSAEISSKEEIWSLGQAGRNHKKRKRRKNRGLLVPYVLLVVPSCLTNDQISSLHDFKLTHYPKSGGRPIVFRRSAGRISWRAVRSGPAGLQCRKPNASLRIPPGAASRADYRRTGLGSSNTSDRVDYVEEPGTFALSFAAQVLGHHTSTEG